MTDVSRQGELKNIKTIEHIKVFHSVLRRKKNNIEIKQYEQDIIKYHKNFDIDF